MASIKRCDICGKMSEGRNADGFHEISRYQKSVYLPDGYSDLCDDCYEEYDEMNKTALQVYRETIENWFKEKLNERSTNCKDGSVNS